MKKLARRVRDMKLSGKMTLFFTVLVLGQFFVSLAILTTIISSTNRDTLTARMSYTRQGVEGYLEETFRDLRVKGELIAGQKKTIEYTDFGLKTLLARELVVFRESLGIDSISVFTDPEYPFASTQKFSSNGAGHPGGDRTMLPGRERSFHFHGGGRTQPHGPFPHSEGGWDHWRAVTGPRPG